jgi:hypothetical protein
LIHGIPRTHSWQTFGITSGLSVPDCYFATNQSSGFAGDSDSSGESVGKILIKLVARNGDAFDFQGVVLVLAPSVTWAVGENAIVKVYFA